MFWNIRHGYVIGRYRYARGIGLDRYSAARHALSIGLNPVIAEAAKYIRPEK